MTTRRFSALLAMLFALAIGGPAAAQDRVWIQIEARPSVASATERAAEYSQRFADVSGFALGGGWYGIVLGPYRASEAPGILAELKRGRQIPSDSFVADGRGFRDQFFPTGTRQPVAGEAAQADTTDEPGEAEPVAVPVIQVPDETAQQARASEAQLTVDEKKELQVALRWAGFYDSTIDGIYGRGTRAAMREWQVANNHEPTGILTTGQRSALFTAYNAVLDGMNLSNVQDIIAGVGLDVPLGVVEFERYDPPFARFAPTGEIPAQVIMISQEGSQATLFGLYDILQTLEVFPTEGPRVRGRSNFEIEGVDDTWHSYVYAELQGSEIKGFALIWPAGDDERRSRILAEMRASFERLDGVLDPSMAEPTEEQAIDLVSGLAVRQPERSRSGVFLNDSGAVLTVAEAVDGCGRVTIDHDVTATVSFTDDASGIAVLTPQSRLVPARSIVFQTRVPRLQSEVAVAGFPFEGVLSAPTLTFGRIADLRGLDGDDTVKRLSIQTEAGDAGGVVLDVTGSALGILLPRDDASGRQLPDDVAFSIDSDAVLTALTGAGITVESDDVTGAITPQELTRRASQMTVMVSCWAE